MDEAIRQRDTLTEHPVQRWAEFLALERWVWLKAAGHAHKPLCQKQQVGSQPEPSIQQHTTIMAVEYMGDTDPMVTFTAVTSWAV